MKDKIITVITIVISIFLGMVAELKIIERKYVLISINEHDEYILSVINSIPINYQIIPSFPKKHDRWVKVPGGQISVSKKDYMLEFVSISGKRYLYDYPKAR